MTEMNLMEKYPVIVLEIAKSETTFKSVDEILYHLKSKIDAHTVAKYIAIFNHYAHTKDLEEGNISTDILDARNIICCFGKDLSNPLTLAIRPRSIGVVEMSDKFVLSFMDAPNPQAHKEMLSWVKSVVNK
ncbi:hypothetical protein MNB_SV-14-1367 [hydrothermal vent metagenome]|uniref:Uncharacterized protein n=1 Tax=hydrothermal vent metagenome TaxID=652676 RepID=A0A1W1CPW0_9ZZZZ